MSLRDARESVCLQVQGGPTNSITRRIPVTATNGAAGYAAYLCAGRSCIPQGMNRHAALGFTEVPGKSTEKQIGRIIPDESRFSEVCPRKLRRHGSINMQAGTSLPSLPPVKVLNRPTGGNEGNEQKRRGIEKKLARLVRLDLVSWSPRYSVRRIALQLNSNWQREIDRPLRPSRKTGRTSQGSAA